MRIVQVSKFHPPVHGGIESTVAVLAEAQHRAGHEVQVLCAHTESRTQHDRAPAGYPVIRAASWGALLSTSVAPALVLELDRLLARARPDVVHLHMPDPLAALALWLTRRRLRDSHVVLHWHADVVRQRIAKRLYAPLQRWLLARADAVIATSQAYAESSLDLRPWRAKVRVVPIGIGDNTREVDGVRVQALRQAYGGRRVVFALGRFVGYKGFDVLVDAASHLPPDCLVLIGGSGGHAPVRRALEQQLVRLGLQSRVKLLGRIAASELPSLFSICDVFCMPSLDRSEAFGVAQLEAMCMGRPVVSSAVPGSGVAWVNRDGETGLTVPPGDAVRLAGALTALLDDAPLRARLGEGARRRWHQAFRAEDMAAGVEALYLALGHGVRGVAGPRGLQS
jgi:glycosyltransferase involved in cell wall biosynthesis